MKALAVLVVAAATVTACSSPAEEARPAATPTTTTPAPDPEDSYIAFLAATDLFPGNVASDARAVWIRTGRTACDVLEGNGGDITDARFKVYRSIIDYSAEGAADPDLAERAVAVVDGASQFLCPDVPAS